ncbi:iron-sulfur cluster co-chaperone protein HscB isoform X1 [Fundulus heteroclitus]|uniref:iron-sulfur cluster co-chaperone protein HscB isoform X1 n=1 Tax=Fundulus heteroclitus TaxID=8078 RepID=UPI00165A152E|nr:iron-sulfur cluster co-chaperone protein HscB isoform X1 [Fundulus heteroclitus]
MFHVSCLRVSSSLRAARCLVPSRHAAPKAVTCSRRCMSTCLHGKGTGQRDGNFGGLVYRTDGPVLSRSCSTSRAKLNCWNCQQLLHRTPSFFCDSCKAVQPPEEGTSYFRIMDCDYTFTLDTQKLQTRYLQLQRTLHPDNFTQKSVKEQEYSESQSALVSKAYKTLLKPLSRGLYMLELEGMHLKEGTDSVAESHFLMELMEINEALDEAQTPEQVSKIGQDTKGKLADLTEQIDAALHQGELGTAKELLTQMKYYANIEEKVKEKLSDFM